MIVRGRFAVPVVGQSLALVRLMNNPIPFLEDQAARFGTLSGLVTFPTKKSGMLIAFAPEYNQQVLSNPDVFHAIDVQEASRHMGESALLRLSSGLVNMNGERHKQHRRLMMPAFHKQAVVSYRDDMVRMTEAMLQRWQIGETVDVMREMRQLVLRIVSKALFGMEDDHEGLGKLVDQWAVLGNNPTSHILPHRQWSLARLSELLEAEFLMLIAQKRASGGSDVLSMLIHAHDEDGTRLSDTELIGQTTILFIAGYETTVNTLAWTLFLLSQYPAILHDLQDELAGVLQGDAPSIEQISQLPLLDRVIKESMRLLPTAIYAFRNAIEPFEMGGYSFQKDTAIILSHYLTHRLPELYPHPNQFLPERWCSINPSPYDYIPFSAGPRLCIGATFASVEIRIVLATLLQRFSLSLEKGVQVDYQTVGNIMRPKDALPMQVMGKGALIDATEVKGNVRKLMVLRNET